MEEVGLYDRLVVSPSVLTLAIGAYAGTLTATTIALSSGQDLTAAATSLPTLVIAVVAAAGGRSISDLGVKLSRTRVHHLFAVVPMLFVGAWMIVDYTTIGLPDGLVPERAVLGYAIAAVPAGVVVLVANNRHVETVVSRQTPDVEWVARKPRSHRYGGIVKWGSGLLVVVAGTAVGVFSGELLASVIGMGIGRVLTGGSSGPDRRGFAVYPDGLVVEQGSGPYGKVYPWSRFTGYSLTDDELRLHRGLGRPAIRCRRSDIDGLRAVRRALDMELRLVEPSSSIRHWI